MFRTKKEVDNHISTVLSRTSNDNDRLLKGYNFARLYFQVEEHESAKRCLIGFLGLKENHVLGHKLMGQIHEATNNLEHALQSYKRSLELDPSQKDLVLKICQLYTQIQVDQETAKYWLERGENLFPHNEVIFKLKELLVKSDASSNHQEELERLFKSEMAANPSTASVSKLLRLYLSQGRTTAAYSLALEEERKGLADYSLLVDICKAYGEELGNRVDPAFYTHYLYFLNKAVSLGLAEPHARMNETSTSASSSSHLNLMDQVLYQAVRQTKPAYEGWPYLLSQMKGQLYFHLACLVLKGATRERGKEAQRLGAALLLVAYCFKPGRIGQESWFHHQGSSEHRLLVEVYRLAVARHLHAALVLNTLAAREDRRLWISKVKAECCIPQVQERIHQRAFESLANAKLSPTSFFMTDSAFTDATLEFPHLSSLQEFFQEAQQVHAASLHHLVWLALNAKVTPTATRLPFPFQLFSSLHYACRGLSNACPESLCQLDMEAFLHATMHCAQAALDRRGAFIAPQAAHAPLSIPPDIAQPLCTQQQADWWSAAHSLVNNAAREKISHLRRTLQHGLEVIRGVGNHGLEISLVAYLARVFADKVTDAKEEGGSDTSALESRAAHYWQLALEQVARLEKGGTLRCPKDPLFPPSGAALLGPDELTALREEGELYLALHAMNQGQLEEAAAKLDKLGSPHASYYLALSLKQLEEKRAKPGTSSPQSTELLTRARNALFLTMDRLRGDPDHPLNREVPRELEEVETRLSGRQVASDTEDSATSSPSYPKNTSQAYYTPPSMPHKAPSMEKLESQLKALTLSQESMNKTLIEQNKCLVDNTKAILEEIKRISASLIQVELQLSDLRELANSLKKSSKLPLENFVEDDLEDFGEGDLGEAGTQDWMYHHHPHNGAAMLPPEYRPNYPPPELSTMGYSPLCPPPPAFHHYPGMPLGPRPPQRPPFYPPLSSTGLPFTEGQPLPHFQFNLPHSPSTEAKIFTPTTKPHSFQIAMPSASSSSPAATLPPTFLAHPPTAPQHQQPAHFFSPPQKSAERQRMDSERSDNPEPGHDPFPDYKPLVPLPDKVDVHTGEEEEVVIFEERAKLFRMVDKEWKERGIGVVKLLKNNSGKFRFIMRRDQVFKICANHYIAEEMNLVSMKNNDKAWIWAAQDFADEVVQQERFCIRFKTAELAKSFKEAVDKCIEAIKKAEAAATPKTEAQQVLPTAGFGTRFLPKPGSWSCPTCLVPNRENQTCCAACTTPKPGAKPVTPTGVFQSKFWICKVCSLSNTSDTDTCEACQSPKPPVKKDFAASPVFGGSTTASKLSFGGDPATLGQDLFAKLATSKATSITPQTPIASTPEKSTMFGLSGNTGTNLFAKLSDSNPPNPEKSIFSQSFGQSPICEKSGDQPITGAITVFDKPITLNKPLLGQAPIGEKSILGQNTFGTTLSGGEKFLFGQTTFGSSQSVSENPVFGQPTFGSTPSSNEKPIFGKSTFESTPSSIEKPIFGQSSFKITPSASEKLIFGQSTSGSTPSSSEKPIFGQSTFGFTPSSSEKPIFGQSAFGSTTSGSEMPVFGQFAFGSTPSVGEKPIFGKPSEIPSNVQTPTSSEKALNQSSDKPITPAKDPQLEAPLLFGKAPPIFGQAPVFGQGSALFGQFSSTPKSEASILAKASSFSFKGSPANMSQDGVPSETPPASGRDIKVSSKSPKPDSTEPKANPFSKFSFSTTPKSTGAINLDGKKVAKNEIIGPGKSPDVSLSKSQSQVDTAEKKEDSVEEFVPTVDFKPVVPLPQLVELKTGEEEEQVLFGEKAKLFGFDVELKQWKEKGRGEMKILRNPQTDKFRILMRRDQVLKVCANHFIGSEMKLQPLQKSENSWVWDAVNMEDEELKPTKLAVKFSKKEVAQQFKKVFEECQSKISKQAEGEQENPPQDMWKCATCLSQNEGTSSICTSCTSPSPKAGKQGEDQVPLSQMFKPKEGSWECPDCYLRNDAKVVVCVSCGCIKLGDSAEPTISLFKFGSTPSNVSFGTPKTDGFVFGQIPQVTTPGGTPGNLVFGSFSASKVSDLSVSSTQDDKPVSQKEFRFGSPLKYEFQFDKSVVTKSPVTSIRSPDASRDEDESGEISETDINFKPIIPLPPKIDPKTGEEDEEVLYSHRAKLFRYCDGVWKERGLGDVKILRHRETGRLRLLMRREQILKLCLNHLLPASTDFISKGERAWSWSAKDYSDMDEPGQEHHFTLRFKSADISQEFKEALDNALVTPCASSAGGKTKKDEKDEDVVVTFEKTASPEQVKKALALQLPKNFYLYETAPPCPGCRGCLPQKAVAPVDEPSVPEPAATPADQEKASEVKEEDKGLVFEKKGMSFADLVQQKSGQDFIATTLKSKQPTFEFPGAGQQVFGGVAVLATAANEEEVIPPSVDPHFEPIIPLPDLVEVRSGEEDEIPIFSERAKLFRFDSPTQQWKERGVGDMKILQHSQQCRYRLLLRRDQVHKVVCNHLIVEGTHLSPMATSSNSLCWVAQDFSEDAQGILEKFAIRFKNAELKEKFEKTFNDCLKSLQENKPLQAGTLSEVEQAVAAEPTSCQNLRAQLSKSEEAEFVMVGEAHGASEGEEEEEEEDSDDDLDKIIMLEDHVVYSVFDGESNTYKPAGKGKIQVIYDEAVYGARIFIYSDPNGELFSDHHIAVQTSLRIDGLSGYWAAMDNALEPPQRRRLCCRFSSKQSLDDFIRNFEEGKDLAVHAEIVENQEFLPASNS